MQYVQQLFSYPVKSLQGIVQKCAYVQQSGFKNDRRLMLCDLNGEFITAREYPKLLQLKTSICNDHIHVFLPTSDTNSTTNKNSIIINLNDFSQSKQHTSLWGSTFTSHIGSITINRFFSEFLNKDVQLRWIGDSSTRKNKHFPNLSLNFVDRYPFLLINQSSFDYLQKKCPVKLDIRQFRANIIVSGCLPFAEDGWKTIRVGNIIFDVIKPCSRCILTGLKIKSNRFLPNNEPLNTLQSFRRDMQSEVDFGMLMIARNEGNIHMQDTVEVIDTQPAKNYTKHVNTTDSTTEKYTIEFLGETYSANDRMTILEQLEKNHVQIPYSCRSGICGRCQVRLISGEVETITQTATKSYRRILACSCIPKTNIVITPIKKTHKF